MLPDTANATVLPDTADHTHYCYAAILSLTGQTHMDLTSRFPTMSSQGNSYIIVVYDFDSNGILVAPLKNCRAEVILEAYKLVHTHLCAVGHCPQLQCLDNEASQALQDYLTTENVDYQLVPPHVHRRNAAKQAIHTFKNHFIAGLCSTDKDFPSISGIDSYLKQNSLSTYSKGHASTRVYPHGHNFMALLISTEHPLPRLASASSSMTSPRCATAGPPTGLMVGTSGLPSALTAATQCGL